MFKKKLICLIIGTAVSVIGGNINLVKNGDFSKLNQERLPQNWRCVNYGSKSTFEIIRNTVDNKNAVCISLPSLKDSAWFRQPLNKVLPQGTLLKISCRYRTENYQQNKYNALFLHLTYPEYVKGSPRNILYLSAAPEWKYAETTFISSEKCNPAINLWAGHSSGKVFITDIKVEVPAQSPSAKDNGQYFWREAENCFKARRATVSRWKPEKIKYSGSGAVGCDNVGLTWKCLIKESIDQKSLLPKPVKYYVWLRLYGYINRPEVTLWRQNKTNRRHRISSWKTVANEQKDASGKYAGPGKFYWQYAGSFVTKGGINKFELTPKGRLYVDAILITDDISCRPEGLKLREPGVKTDSSFKTMENAEKVFIDSSYTLFGVTDKFPTPLNFRIFSQKGFETKRMINDPAYIYFALPDWIDVKGISSHWAGQNHKTEASAGFLKLSKLEPQKFDGFVYNVYRSPVYCLRSWICLFIKGKSGLIPFGKRRNVYFWLQDKKQKTSTRKMLVEAVDLKVPVRQFKDIFIGPMGGNMRNFLRDCPNLPGTLKYCGFNVINALGTEKQEYLTKDFIKACNSLNIAVIGELSPGYKYWREKPVYALNDKGKVDILALALHLNRTSPYMQRMMQGINNIIKGGISGLSMDDEVFNRAYDTIDFSPETKELFKSYLSTEHPDLKYIEPLEIVKNKRQLKKLYQAWVNFRCSRVTSWYKLYAEAYGQALKKYNSNSTFGKKYLIPVIVNGRNYEKYKQRLCFDLKQLAKQVTHISPMIYTYSGIKQAGLVGESIKNFYKFSGLKENIITPTLLGGHDGFGEIPYSQQKMVKYEIYECLINKSPGMFFWVTPGTINPLVLRQIMTALKTAVPYEDFFVKGNPVEAKITPKALKANALNFGGRIIVYVSNYNLEKNIEAVVKVPGGNIKKLIDLETGDLLSFTKNRFTVDFNKERGRMFLVEFNQ